MAKKEGITYEQIISDLQQKKYTHIYFLTGDESYYIDKVSDYIENNVLDESAKDFNQIIFYGGQTSMDDIISAAKGYPLSSDYKVVIVKEAQNIKKEKDKDKKEKDAWENLYYYLQKPQKSTILVFCFKYGTPDKRLKWFKEIEKSGVILVSNKIPDYDIVKWINAYIKSNEIEMDGKAVELLSNSLGTDLTKIINELDKLLITLPAGSRKITEEHIERYVGISKDFNVFELQAALTQKDALKSNRIAFYFADNKKVHPIQMILPQLFNFFVNILFYHYLPAEMKYTGNAGFNERSAKNAAIGAELGIRPYPAAENVAKAAEKFTVRKTVQIISYLRQADARSKGFDVTENNDMEIYKELIYRILH